MQSLQRLQNSRVERIVNHRRFLERNSANSALAGFNTMERIQKRFDELMGTAQRISQSQGHQQVRKPATIQTIYGPDYYTEDEPTLDGALLIEWQTSVLSLLERVFGKDAATYQQFAKTTNFENCPQTLHGYFTQLRAIFQSAKNDFEGGHLFDVRNLVHAEVFADELEQAKHFLDAGYKVPAAVIAGTVLETALRELCSQHGVSASEKLNSMDDELTKASVYNAGRKSQVKAWADIRNSAAHGRPDEFEPGDVSRMIDGIREFVACQMR